MRTSWILLLLALLLICGAALFLFRSPPDWSTDSDEALAEYELGLEARMKFYEREAQAHFERALDLDPDFVAPKIGLLDCCAGPEQTETIIEDLRRLELDRLTSRERFLVQYAIADADRQPEERQRIVEAYVETHPKDPFALWFYANQAWYKQDLEAAEKRYRRLLKVDPNWVLAQNRLGYIAMAQGRFAEAEDQFGTYKYIAPDQANPHDSLGELLTLLGRYDEAEQQLEAALAIKSDFCASYRHLMLIVILAGPLEAGDEIIERAEPHCSEFDIKRLRCQLQVWRDFFDGNWQGPWEEEREPCTKVLGDFNFLLHRMELLTGRHEEALAREERVRARIAEMEEETGIPFTYPRGYLHYMEGARLALEGEYEAAADRFEEADGYLLYWFESQGILKLYNLLHLAYALEMAGHEDTAQRVIAKVEAVNPQLAAGYEKIKKLFGEG